MKRFFFLLISAASAALFADGTEEVAPRVTITSQPAGATIIVDGRDRGVTPITLFDLEKGRHHLKYRLAGYEEKNRFFSTEEGPLIEKSETLVETKGILLVKSDPEGAKIEIDGLTVGTTPRLVLDLAAKDAHTIKLEKNGYKPVTMQAKFEGRKPLVKEAVLTRDSGTISVTSEPSGAEVTVNGIVRGITPLEVNDVPRGRAAIKLKLDGFKDAVRELAIRAGDKQTLAVALTAKPGTIQLTSVPEGARFYVNGESKGKGPITLTDLTPGEYAVKVELEGYGTQTKQLKLENGGTVSEEFRLSNVMGRIEVRTQPPGATVVLDGRILGQTKSKGDDSGLSEIFAIENVLEGEHLLIARKEGYQDSVRHPNVQNSKTSKQHAMRLKKLFIPDVEVETIRGVTRGIMKSNSGDYVRLEITEGVEKSIPKSEVRKINFLERGK